MAKPDNLILMLLREMRERMDARFDAVDARFSAIDRKLVEHDQRFKSISQALQGDSLLGQYATAEFDERFQDLEKRVQALESRN